MNEKIKQLAKEAGMWRQHYDIGEESPAGLEKFAELIVRECMDAIYDIDDLGGYHFKAANAVKQHFGVKE